MRGRPTSILGVFVAALLLLAACGPTADVTADELESIVLRDAVAFDPVAMPDDVLDRIAGNQLVILGETHHLREHWALVSQLLDHLHGQGFRQLLIESPHMASWLFDDYVHGGILVPGWEPSPFYERQLGAIRELNQSLAPDERVHVFAVDVNEDHYGGAASFRELLALLVSSLPPATVEVTLEAGYGGSDAARQTVLVEELLATLAAGEDTLAGAWGVDWYDRVVEMAEVELASIEIRQERLQDDDAAAQAREEALKWIVDAHLSRGPDHTLMNIGGHHAQKSHLMGTEQEWLGDYLVHRSSALEGPVMVIGFTSARTELEPGAQGTTFDVKDTSPKNEILRVMAETMPGATVWLPLDDPLFQEREVAYSSEEVTYVTSLAEQFDVLIQYGLAHRMPLD